MRNWLKYNPLYSKIENSYPIWTPDTPYSDKHTALLNMFQNAINLKPEDFHLNEALGILYFNGRDLETSANYFRKAVSLEYFFDVLISKVL